MPPKLEAKWQALTTGPVAVGPEARAVLLIRALRDVEVRNVLCTVLCPPAGLSCEIALAETEAVHGVSPARVLTAGRVTVHQDLPAPRPGARGAVLRYGEWEHTEEQKEKDPTGDHYWQLCGVMPIPRGVTVALLVSTSGPARCRACVEGV